VLPRASRGSGILTALAAADGLVGFQNSATSPDLGFYAARSLVFVDEAAKDGPAFDPLLGEISDGVAGRGGWSWRLR
jgi:hypothetical protein